MAWALVGPSIRFGSGIARLARSDQLRGSADSDERGMQDRRKRCPSIGLPVAQFMHQRQTVLLAALISQLLQPQFHVVAGDHHHDLAALGSFEAQLRFRRLPAALGRTVHGLRTRLKYDRLVLDLDGPLSRTITPSLR